MKSAIKNKTALLIIDAIIFMLCIFGVYRIALKAYLPFDVLPENSYLIISQISEDQLQFAVGDTVLSVDGYNFGNWEEIELYTDGKNIGDEIHIVYLINGITISSNVTLVPYYSVVDIVIISLAGILFIFLAIFVAFKSEEKSAIIFHWASVGLTMVITMTLANYSVGPVFLNVLIHCLFLFAFTATPVLFVHFTYTFTSFRSAIIKKLIYAFYVIAALLAGYLCSLYFDATQHESLSSIHRYVQIYTFVFRPFLLISVFSAIIIFYKAYRRAKDLTTKRKLNWLLLGFLIGPAAFILFWVIPMIFLGYSLLTEGLMHLLLISVPITFAIAIIKYRLLDINLILKRSVVYTIVISGLIVVYILIFTSLTLMIKGIEDTIPAVIAAVIVAIFMNPVKNRVQKFVDRKFFRVQYNFKEEQKKYLNDVKESNDIYSMAEKVVDHTDKLIPVEKIGFFMLEENSNKIKLIAHKNFDLLVSHSVKFQKENLKTDLSLPVAVDDKIERGLNVESADRQVFKRWGMVLVFPVKSPNGIIHGFLVLGAKKSGFRFNEDDVDLLNTVVTTIALTMDRIKLQRELIIKQIQAEQLEELSRMKSLFVSTVSHELKTPLTSIKMFAEMLKDNPDCSTEKAQEYLQIIEGESERLKRLINNVLDFTKIEKGIKTYDKRMIELNNVVSKVLKSMEYQFKIAQINLDINLNEQSFNIFADNDAVEEAVMNILSNAIKYSKKNTTVAISTFKKEKYACVKIKDNGIGISGGHINRIFEPFYRTENNLIKSEGTGLGLSIVKHIIDAHNGKIEIESNPGKGSSFILLFPMED